MTSLMATACVNEFWDDVGCARAIEAGANWFRISAAYGAEQDHIALLKRLRAAAHSLSKEIVVAYDLNRGTKLRLRGPDARRVERGSRFLIGSTPDPATLSFERAPANDIHVNDLLIFGDSELRVRVTGLTGRVLECEALSSGTLSPGKSVTSPDVELGLGVLNEVNRPLLRAACYSEFDYVVLSFVRTAEEVEEVRLSIERLGVHRPGLIAKIETREAISNLDKIIGAADALMVARGDLAIQVGIADLAVSQWTIAERALALSTPFVVATQVFESVLERSSPTASDVLDVAAAVGLGASAVMLGPETCKNPGWVEAIRTVRSILAATEGSEIRLSVLRRAPA